jgi:hypothetical protein
MLVAGALGFFVNSGAGLLAAGCVCVAAYSYYSMGKVFRHMQLNSIGC